MQSILRISDAAAIALHTADYLASQEKPLSQAMEITKALDISYNHLSKVLQQLTKAGLMLTARGPKGGFTLSPAGKKAKVRDFIAAIDGLPAMKTCLLKHKVCGHRDCMFGNFLSDTNKRFEAVLNVKISELSKRK
ncbi:MAG: Rrf2 family transcriptional regulator [Elusimicrobiota bacterium]|nr:Rrf2 family transcriptional regulator [Elusimicrobiota bacterium]